MYLGLDLGTSGVKALLIDDNQYLVGEYASRPLAVTRAHPSWSEQDPALWWAGVCEAMDGLKARHGRALSAVRGIGLSGQMYGATVLDGEDRPLRPAILWNDMRTARECADLAASLPEGEALAGRSATPGVTAVKLAWLARHEPEVFAQVRSVLLPKDYIRLLMTGDKASDRADSSGTYWMDVARRDWSDALLAATGMQRSQMPELFDGTEPTGRLRADLAARWGMAAQPVFAGGGGDNACGACGVGAVGDGAGTVSLGTSGVLFVASDTPRPTRGISVETLCHAVPGMWHQMSVVLSATSTLNWLAARLKRSARDLVTELGSEPRPATDLLFVPYLDGCWSPRFDPQIRGGFFGLAHQHDDAAMTQAVLQGVAFALRDSADAFRAAGTRLDRLVALGGGSQSVLWLSIIASVLDADLDLPEASELGAAFGAARLAMVAANNARPETVLRAPKLRGVVRPHPAHADSYTSAYEAWQSLVPVLGRIAPQGAASGA